MQVNMTLFVLSIRNKMKGHEYALFKNINYSYITLLTFKIAIFL